MSTADVAAKLRALADRVRRNLPMNGDPERFHLEKSEIARAIINMAIRIEAKLAPVAPVKPMPRNAKGRTIIRTSTMVIGGRAVTVQQRRPSYAIHVGE